MKHFWGHDMGTEDNRKAKRLNNLKKEFQRLKESLKTIIHLQSLKATLKKVPNRKTSGQ